MVAAICAGCTATGQAEEAPDPAVGTRVLSLAPDGITEVDLAAPHHCRFWAGR